MIRGKLSLGYMRDALHQYMFLINKKDTKEPLHAKDGDRDGKTCPESQGIATVSLVWRIQIVVSMCSQTIQRTRFYSKVTPKRLTGGQKPERSF